MRSTFLILFCFTKYRFASFEDLLHHEVNSLRCTYNYINVLPTAPPNEQILRGSRFETLLGEVEILNIEASISDKSDSGSVQVKFCKKEQTSWTVVNLELTKLQVTVVRKKPSSYNPSQTGSENLMLEPSPALDWPSCAPSKFETSTTDKELTIKNTKEIINNKFTMSEPAMFISKIPLQIEEEEDTEYNQVQNMFKCVRSGSVKSGWDPTGGNDYMLWDPFEQIQCEICKKGDNERCILICDKCNLGYHTYCLRPVVSNIPTYEWICPECSCEETGREGFEKLVKDLIQNFSQVTSFLSLPFQSSHEIQNRFEDVVKFLSSTIPKSQRFAVFGYGKKKTLTTEIGGVHLSRRTCKHLWLLPEPKVTPDQYCHSFATMVAAMKYCGVTQYSEELVYASGVSEEMNDASKDSIQKMSKDNTTLFKLYKENLRNGAYPPLEVVYDDGLGFTVHALCSLPRHTILTEYVGEVTTIEKCNETNSDSLMILLDTGDPKTSLIIDPTRISNIARFLSGVNNRSFKSKRKANVRTRRFVVDGKSRVVLFTSRDIKEGESLNYDYNAGNEGKSVKDILRTGFYDTSNFF